MLNNHLYHQLDSFLDLNVARLKCLTLLIASVLRQRTVNLTFLATENLTGAKNESCYRRFQRFFLLCVLPQEQVARLIISKIPRPSRGWALSMDRTNWKYGKRHINILINGKAAFRHGITGKGKKQNRLSVMGMKLYFSNKVIQSKGRRDTHLHVVSNRFSGREALALYRQRWGIEQFFSHLKKRGFDLEVTHMTCGEKLEKLFAIVTLGFLSSYAWGCQLRKMKKATAATKRQSTFRLGLENLLRLLSNPHLKEKERRDFTDWLRLPIYDSIFVV